MAAESSHARLGEVAEVHLSSVDKKSMPGERSVFLCNYTDVYHNRHIRSDLPFMAATATDREIERFSLRAGDTIITKDSESYDDIGVPALLRENVPKLVCGYHLALLRPRTTRVDSSFLYYLLTTRNVQRQFHAFANGSTRFSLSKRDIGSIQLVLPSRSSQAKIGAILDALEDRIHMSHRLAETVEAIAFALYKSWFIDFEPVRAKMKGSWSDGQSNFGVRSEHYDLFPSSFVSSGQKEIPEGWEIRSIRDVTINLDARRIPLSGAERIGRNGSFPYYGAASVLDHVDDYIFDGTHVLIGEDGSVVSDRGLAVSQYVSGKFWVNNHAHVLQGTSPVSTEHLFLHFGFERVLPFVTGAVQPKLSQGRLNTMPFLFPGDAICRAFSSAIRPLFTRIQQARKTASTLSQLRDTLLPRLVDGRLTVPTSSLG